MLAIAGQTAGTNWGIFLEISWIYLEGAGSFGVLSRFSWYNLYVYTVQCTAHSNWLDVGLVLEMNRTWA